MCGVQGALRLQNSDSSPPGSDASSPPTVGDVTVPLTVILFPAPKSRVSPRSPLPPPTPPLHPKTGGWHSSSPPQVKSWGEGGKETCERPRCAESRRTRREELPKTKLPPPSLPPLPPRRLQAPTLLPAQGFVIAEVSVDSLTSLIITLPHNLVPCWQGPCLSC